MSTSDDPSEFEVFPENRPEPQTLEQLLELIRREVQANTFPDEEIQTYILARQFQQGQQEEIIQELVGCGLLRPRLIPLFEARPGGQRISERIAKQDKPSIVVRVEALNMRGSIKKSGILFKTQKQKPPSAWQNGKKKPDASQECMPQPKECRHKTWGFDPRELPTRLTRTARNADRMQFYTVIYSILGVCILVVVSLLLAWSIRVVSAD